VKFLLRAFSATKKALGLALNKFKTSPRALEF
jgi:hypothetical protein